MRIKLWPVLVVLNLALAWGLGALWLDEDFDLKNILWRAPVAIPPASDSLTVHQITPLQRDLSQLNSTGERPLFWASRRPPPPPPLRHRRRSSACSATTATAAATIACSAAAMASLCEGADGARRSVGAAVEPLVGG